MQTEVTKKAIDKPSVKLDRTETIYYFPLHSGYQAVWGKTNHIVLKGSSFPMVLYILHLEITKLDAIKSDLVAFSFDLLHFLPHSNNLWRGVVPKVFT